MADVSHRNYTGSVAAPGGAIDEQIADLEEDINALEVGLAAEIARALGAESALDVRVDALEAAPGGGGGEGESYHKLVNILDYEDDCTDILAADDVTVIGQNWALPFMNAVDYAVDNGLKGVFIPAREDAYLIGKRGPLIQDSIDLDGRSDLLFLGEGDGSRLKLCGSGNTRAWNMFACTNSENITFDRLYFDGGRDSGSAFELDPGEQTHLIQIGGGVVGTGAAFNTVVRNCTFFDIDGDGLRLLGGGLYGGGGECSGVRVMDCTFREIERACVSHSRTCENIHIVRNFFYGKTTSGQLIDYEPTGSEVHRGPRNNIIAYNYMEMNRADVAALTLGGISPVDYMCSTGHLVAFNQVYGGRLDVGDTIDLTIAFNNFHSATSDADNNATAYFRGRTSNMRFIGNKVVRLAGASPGTVFYLGQTNGGWPEGCSITHNVFHSYVDAATDGAVVRLNDNHDLDFSHNEVAYYGTDTVTAAIRAVSTATSEDTTPYKNWNIKDNRVLGDLGGGLCTYGILTTASSSGEDVDGVVITGNSCRGVTYRVGFDKGGSSVFTSPPVVHSNIGDGTDFGGLASSGALMIGGNGGSQAVYMLSTGTPAFTAARNSLCIIRDGAEGARIYVNTTGSTTWVPLTDVDGGGP